MKNVYHMFNDIETNLDEYEVQEFSEFEAKKWEQKMKKQIHKPKSGKHVAAAACAVLVLGALAFGPFRQQVFAAMDSATEAISDWLTFGTDKRNLSPYANVINTSVVDDEIEVKLESVILDEHELLISTIQTYSGEKTEKIVKDMENGIDGSWSVGIGDFDEIRESFKIPENNSLGYPCMAAIVSVDGKELKGREKIVPLEAEDGKVRVLYKYYIDDKQPLEIEEEIKMKIELQEMTGISDGSWEFAFQADGKEIIADTFSVPLNQKVKLPHGEEITLTRYKRNELGTYIYYEGPAETDYFLQLRGTNDRKETVWFYHQGIDEDQMGRFELLPLNEMRAKDAKALNLSVYWHEYPEGDEDVKDAEYELYGDPFTLDIEDDVK